MSYSAAVVFLELFILKKLIMIKKFLRNKKYLYKVRICGGDVISSFLIFIYSLLSNK